MTPRLPLPPAVEWEASADLVVAGSGVAGLTAALCAEKTGLRVDPAIAIRAAGAVKKMIFLGGAR